MFKHKPLFAQNSRHSEPHLSVTCWLRALWERYSKFIDVSQGPTSLSGLTEGGSLKTAVLILFCTKTTFFPLGQLNIKNYGLHRKYTVHTAGIPCWITLKQHFPNCPLDRFYWNHQGACQPTGYDSKHPKKSKNWAPGSGEITEDLEHHNEKFELDCIAIGNHWRLSFFFTR